MTNPADTPTRSGPDLARQFAELWEQEPRPDVQQFLTDAGDVHPAQAGEVLRLDQRERWRRGERPRLQEYLKVYPALRADVDQLLASVRQEFSLRRQHGESPSVSEYLRLFPEHSDLLRQALSVPEPPDEEDGDGFGSTSQGLTESFPTLPTAGAPPVPDALALPSMPGYNIVRELGRGGMGVVYQAFDRKRQRMVALKTMQGVDPRALLRFKQEF